jgi:hypothetical protein
MFYLMTLLMLENMALKRIFGSKRDVIWKRLKKLRNEELPSLYCLSNVIGMIRSRRTRRADM